MLRAIRKIWFFIVYFWYGANLTCLIEKKCGAWFFGKIGFHNVFGYRFNPSYVANLTRPDKKKCYAQSEKLVFSLFIFWYDSKLTNRNKKNCDALGMGYLKLIIKLSYPQIAFISVPALHFILLFPVGENLIPVGLFIISWTKLHLLLKNWKNIFLHAFFFAVMNWMRGNCV